MADVRLVTLLPSQPVQGVQQGPLSQGSTSQVVAGGLPVGTVLSGFIINRDATGNPILRTPSGDIPFATQFFLKIGSEVTLRIENLTGESVAHILSVDGQPPEIAETQSSFGSSTNVVISQQFSPAQTSAANTATNQTAVQNEPVVNVTGTLISQSIATASSAAPALVAGTQLVFKVVSVNVTSRAYAANASTSALPTDENTPPAPQSNSVHYAAYARVAIPTQPTTQPVPQSTTQANVSPAVSSSTQIVASQLTVPQAQAVNTSATPATNTPIQTSNIVVLSPETTPSTTVAIVQPESNLPQTSDASGYIVQPDSKLVPAPEHNGQIQNSTTTVSTAPTFVAETTSIATSTPLTVVSNASTITPEEPIAVSNTYAQPIAQVLPENNIPTTTISQNSITTQPVVDQAQAGQIFTGTVIGTETTQEALVQTPLGVVRLQAGTVLPTGSTITLQLVQSQPPAAPNAINAPLTTPALTDPAPITQLAQQWSALQQIFDILAGRTTPTGLDNGSNLSFSGETTQQTPVTAQGISTAMLTFISALRGGDFGDWLGNNNVKWLEEKGHSSLLKKVGAEFSSLARQFAAPATQHWQPLFFPVNVEGQLQQVRIYVKRDRQQSANQQESSTEDTRFVVEVDLTKLGELQMDGFVRKDKQSTQFDMVIRSLLPLSKEIQQDIAQIYNDTAAMTGYKGSITFQSVKEFPVNPMNEIITGINSVVA